MLCTSDHRCRLRSCEPCSWRFSRRLTEAILTVSPRVLLSVEMTVPDGSFPATSIRNVMDYRRSGAHACASSRAWRSVGIHVFDGHDQVRGVLTARVIPVDLVEILNDRWRAILRVIEPEQLRETIYRAVHPNVIRSSERERGGHQDVRLSIWPRQEPSIPKRAARVWD